MMPSTINMAPVMTLMTVSWFRMKPYSRLMLSSIIVADRMSAATMPQAQCRPVRRPCETVISRHSIPTGPTGTETDRPMTMPFSKNESMYRNPIKYAKNVIEAISQKVAGNPCDIGGL